MLYSSNDLIRPLKETKDFSIVWNNCSIDITVVFDKCVNLKTYLIYGW